MQFECGKPRIALRAFSVLHGCALAALLALGACNNDNGGSGNTDAACMQSGAAGDNGNDEAGDVGPRTGSTCPDSNPPTYDNFGKQFMQKYCLRCHSQHLTCAARMGAPADHNFDVELGIIGNVKHIDEVAAAGPDATNMVMPPSDPMPSLDERKKLGEFIACEAKNSGQEL